MSELKIAVSKLTGIPDGMTREAFWKRVEQMRQLGPEGRSRLAFKVTERARKATKADVRRRHPEYTEKHVLMAAFRIWYGDELFRQVFPNQEIEP